VPLLEVIDPEPLVAVLGELKLVRDVAVEKDERLVSLVEELVNLP